MLQKIIKKWYRMFLSWEIRNNFEDTREWRKMRVLMGDRERYMSEITYKKAFGNEWKCQLSY